MEKLRLIDKGPGGKTSIWLTRRPHIIARPKRMEGKGIKRALSHINSN